MPVRHDHQIRAVGGKRRGNTDLNLDEGWEGDVRNEAPSAPRYDVEQEADSVKGARLDENDGDSVDPPTRTT